MDDDLKIVVSLEADKEVSAQRISAQLPEIARLINSRGNIKVRVSLDSENINSQVQGYTKRLNRAVTANKVGINLSIDEGSIQAFQSELQRLNVSPDIGAALTAQLDQMGVQIDRISGRWSTAEDSQERLLQLTIQGTDQLGRTVSYLQTYSEESGEIQIAQKSVLLNLERQRIESEKIARQQQRNDESRLAFLLREQGILEKTYNIYTGQTSGKGIVDREHIDSLNQEYERLLNLLREVSKQSGRLSDTQRADIDQQVKSLMELVRSYQELEYVPTKLRARTVWDVNAGEAKGLDEYEQKLRDVGVLTDSFKNRIAELRTELSTAFDGKSLIAYQDHLDELRGDVDVFRAHVKSLNDLYGQLTRMDREATNIRIRMVGVDPSSSQEMYSSLQDELAMREQAQEEINQKIREQYAILAQQVGLGQDIQAGLNGQEKSYSSLVQYVKRAADYEAARSTNQARLETAEAAVADQVSHITAELSKMPSVVRDVEARFSQLQNPTAELTNRVKSLNGLMHDVESSSEAQEKISAYNRLQDTLRGCNQEITSLMRLQRMDVADSRFQSNLEKASANLENVGRRWSALFSDRDLTARFQALENNLKNISSSADLSKWTGEFNAFRAQVQAAGRDTQRLWDIITNNLSKVSEWATATTILYQGVNRLRQALETIIALDTALVDLRKTTDETNIAYDTFYRSANDTAKELGATTEEIIQQTAEWSRLGYTMSEAAKLAENSAIFSSISEDLDLEAATDGLVSILKAFDELEEDDALDGVISKINEVGNRFAVNNGDIVDAMTRSSSAMAVANNTFEQTVALATAAIEITRDASSVGNALKTISMRIRGYDEETEELSEDLTNITGTIADLTKVSSNNFTGISLFEDGDMDTYRSTYDILADIADIWDELTDKNRAELLEALFGKQRAQVGAALLSNFDQAKNAMDTMAESAGSAEKEMENITQSLEYKLNRLWQTWVGVAQNLLDRGGISTAIDMLNGLSEAVDWATERLGLLGTVGLGTLGVGLSKFISQFQGLTSSLTSIGPMGEFDGSDSSIIQYAAAISDLSSAQQRAALSAMGLNQEQQETVISMVEATASVRSLTVAEAERAAGLKAGTLATALNVKGTEQLTVEMLKTAAAADILSKEQVESIANNIRLAATNQAAAVSYTSLGARIKAAGLAMLSTPIGIFTTIVSVLPLAISLLGSLYDQLVVTSEEAYEAAMAHREAYEEATQKAEEYGDEIEKNNERIQELQELADNGAISIADQNELETLRQTNEELRIRIEREKELAAIEAKDANEDLIESFDKKEFTSLRQDSLINEYNAIQETYRDLFQLHDQYEAGLADMTQEQLDLYDQQIQRLDEITLELNSGESGGMVDYATHVQEVIALYNELEEKRRRNGSLSDSEQAQLEGYREELVRLSGEIDEDLLQKYEGSDADSQRFESLLDLIDQTIYAVQYFEEQLASLPDECYDQLMSYGTASELTAEKVEELAHEFPDLAQWMESSGYTAEETAAHFNSWGNTMDGSGERARWLLDRIQDLRSELIRLSNQTGNADLSIARNVVVSDENVEDLSGYGVGRDQIGQSVSIPSQIYTDGDQSIVVTPVLPNGDVLSKEELDAYIQNVIAGAESGDYASNDQKHLLMGVFDGEEVAKEFAQVSDEISRAGDELNGLLNETDSIDDLIQIGELDLTPLHEIGSGVQSVLGVIADAQEEMYTNGAVSADTIRALSEITDDYTDYLYEENGAIQLNVNALKDLANSKVDSATDDIREENRAYQLQNDLLQERIKYYEEQRKLGSDGGIWDKEIENATQKIQENNAAIAENLSLIAQYESLSDPWESTFSTFDSVTSGLEQLANLQQAVAEGFTISAQQAREFAQVYPEILNQATVAANGEIQLNADVVNNTISGQETILRDYVEAEISKLEAKKASLQAELGIIDQQIAAVKSGDDAQVRSANEAAIAQIMLQQTILSACEQAGIDSAAAQEIAAAAMTEDWGQFTKLAKEAVDGLDEESALSFTSVMTNFATLAQRMIGNTNEVIGAFSQMGTALQNAMKGVGTGPYSYSISFEGVTARAKEEMDDLLEEFWDGNQKAMDENTPISDDSWERWAKELQSIVDNYVSATPDLTGLEAQRDTINAQIQTIDNQIKVLESLKNTPLERFVTDTSKATKENEKAAKAVEEYTTEIDAFREAIRRLNQAQAERERIEQRIEDSDDLKEQIRLRRELADAYRNEQAALHNLNNARDNTISQGVQSLRNLGFEIEYNADTNDLWISNLDHINELMATNQGEYETLQEATNEFRKETEDLIDSITELNENNQESSANWQELQREILGTDGVIQDLLDSIVEEASGAVDELQDVYDTLHQAADEYAESGYIMVDTLQQIVALGPEYLAYLYDENGQLVINEMRIRMMVAAKTQQLAVETSLAYVEALRMAKESNDIETLRHLTAATENTSDATWGLVYANLALLDLSEEQEQAALRNINALRSLAESAMNSIGKEGEGVGETLEAMQTGLEDILQYVMDMLQQQIEDQIQSLEDMKDAYSEIIELKRESLQAERDEADRKKETANRMKEIAKLQARIDALSLDDSREAQAERARLQEELAALQEEQADAQADYTLDAQLDALDDMEEAYHDEKDEEIKVLEDSISSYQKLYDKAIDYIGKNWDSLYQELLNWNYEYGNDTSDAITEAWENALAAAQRYGSYVNALNSIGGDIESGQSGGGNTVVGDTGKYPGASNTDIVHALVSQMKSYASQWGSSANPEALQQKAAAVEKQLHQYGVEAKFNSGSGTWVITKDTNNPSNVGKLLYSVYHTGGIVGDGDIKANEQFALLKKKEWVLSEDMVKNLTAQMDRISILSESMDRLSLEEQPKLMLTPDDFSTGGSVTNVTNNSNSHPVTVTIGDTIIQGAGKDTIRRHEEISRDMVDQIAGILGVRK